MSGLAGRRVVVAGAGLAGISAALECARLGARVTLLERRSRLGGLTWSFAHGDLTFDNGQHVYLACCDQYQRFLTEIGAAGDVVAPRPLDIPVVAPGRSGPVVGRLRRRDLPVPLHLAGSLMRYPHISLASRLNLGRALLGLARLDLDDPALDRITFGEWLAARGQAADAVAAVWDLITIPTVNLPASDASLSVAAMVMKTGLLSNSAAADIGWSRVPLGQLHGERAAAALATAGVTVHREVRVLAVALSESGVWEVATSDGPLEADAVVVALPHEEAAAVVPSSLAAVRGQWSDLGSSAIVDVHLVFDRRVMPWDLMAAHRSDIQWVFDRSDSSGLNALHPGQQYLAVSLSAADHLVPVRPSTILASTLDSLRALLPAMSDARLVDSLVTKERRATFAPRPGTATLRPPATTAMP
ncbi:MAG TPA: hydroxysqualene dehydroxylase HpnE, partial [Acidimicrobiales bacterium]|nr:hydroxysqualene dehydroxylase HpnE [Acidimicrobiales bacterium]